MSGKVISILDVGSRTNALLTAGLSVSLRQETKRKIALFDFSFFPVKGKMKILFNLPLQKNFISLIPFIDQLNARMLEGYFETHSSGIDLLSGCFNRNEMSGIKPEHLMKIVSFLSQIYDYTLINLDNDFNDNSLSLLDRSNLIILMATSDRLSLEGAKEILSILYSLHYAPQSIKIVLNIGNIEETFFPPGVEDYLKKEIFYKINYDCKKKSSFATMNSDIFNELNFRQIPFYKSVQGLTWKLLEENVFMAEGLGKGRLTLGEKKNPNDTGLKLNNDEGNNQDNIKNQQLVNNKIDRLKTIIQERLISEMDLKGLDFKEAGINLEKGKEVKQKIKGMVERLLNEEGSFITNRRQREKIISDLLDDILGLGPLERLLKDSSVSEIMVNKKDEIYIEKQGKIELTDIKLASNRQILTIIERIVAPLGRHIDESSPLVDARLKDGSRVNAIIPPLALDGPTITIRKFTEKKLVPNDLINLGSISKEMIEFIRVCVQLKKNIIISGGTGSGKTTFLNIISSFIPQDERIITIEDSAELKLPQGHVVRLESRPPNIEGEGEISIRRLLINCLRMRPDRIIIGECRGGEAIDMLQAMNTGHEGSLTTLHANNPRDALSRLETMVLMSGMELPSRAIRDQIANSINIIVQLNRLNDGTRKLTCISEVTGLQGDVITTADIFKFIQKGIDEQGKIMGNFEFTGVIPSFIEKTKTHNVSFDKSIFQTV